MKERLWNVLAWVAFTNAVILVAGTVLVLAGVTTNDFGVLGERFTAYMAMYVRTTYICTYALACGLVGDMDPHR